MIWRLAFGWPNLQAYRNFVGQPQFDSQTYIHLLLGSQSRHLGADGQGVGEFAGLLSAERLSAGPRVTTNFPPFTSAR